MVAPDAAHLPRPQPADLLAHELDAVAGGALQSDERARKGRFPGTRLPDDAERLAGGEREAPTPLYGTAPPPRLAAKRPECERKCFASSFTRRDFPVLYRRLVGRVHIGLARSGRHSRG